jgi:hypothetical protein
LHVRTWLLSFTHSVAFGVHSAQRFSKQPIAQACAGPQAPVASHVRCVLPFTHIDWPGLHVVQRLFAHGKLQSIGGSQLPIALQLRC